MLLLKFFAPEPIFAAYIIAYHSTIMKVPVCFDSVTKSATTHQILELITPSLRPWDLMVKSPIFKIGMLFAVSADPTLLDVEINPYFALLL